MIDFTAPDMVIGALASALAVIYAAWHEYKVRNQRDAKLLAAVGLASLLGCAVIWRQ
jgi:hypothetical protein